MREGLGVGDLVDGLEQRGSRLPFEIGAFVALEACEDLIERSVVLDANDVRVTTEGQVVLDAEASGAAPSEAAQSLLLLLRTLLVAAGPGVPPSLMHLVSQSTTSSVDLARLRDEIQASLIPLNRGASRRVLARLVRDASRAMLGVPTVSARQADAELDEFLELGLEQQASPVEPAPAPNPAPPEPEPVVAQPPEPAAPEPITDASVQTEAEAAPQEPERTDLAPPKADAPHTEGQQSVPSQLLERSAEPVAVQNRVEATEIDPPEAPHVWDETEAPVPVAALRQHVVPHDPVSVEAQEYQRAAEDAALADEDPQAVLSRSLQPARRSRSVLALGTLVLSFFLWWLLQDNGVSPEVPPVADTSAHGTHGAIQLVVTPADAQVLHFVGRGPAIAHRLKAGAPHEFVVVQEGYVVSRTVVHAEAPWTASSAGPLYELAVQLASNDNAEALSYGLPEIATTAEVGEGRVRVVTNPPGAKVYRFLGRGPKLTLQNAPAGEAQEFVVLRAGYAPKNVVLAPTDWRRGDDGVAVADLDVTLQ